MNDSIMPVVLAGVFSLLVQGGVYVYCLNTLIH